MNKKSDLDPVLSIDDIDLDTVIAEHRDQVGPYYPSPSAWEDQVFYFLITDRFSDGNEADVLQADGETRSRGERARFTPQKDIGNAVKNEKAAARWRESGISFTGGNLRGLIGKLGYLKRMGITTVWISPLLKQAPFAQNDYHGYGTQNFLAIDPRFGTRADLRELTQKAHELGIYVVLDIILNHCCDAFAYDGDENRPWTGEQFPVKGFRDQDGQPVLPFGHVDRRKAHHADCAIWPSELQHPEAFTRKGYITDWDNWPEYEEGDFFSFKDFNLGTYTGGDKAHEEVADSDNCEEHHPEFVPSEALKALTEVYKFWIAEADLDGFRIDTVKHMGPGPACWFGREIKGFTQKIGKNNFILVGEIAGGRAHAHWMLCETGLDAALGIDEIPEKMRGVIRGEASACEYFGMFINSRKEQAVTNDPNWWRNRVVTFFDDHDQVGRATKGRLASTWGGEGKKAVAGLIRALGFDLTTLGIPCVYYGTEQGFDGHAFDPGAGDRFIRESMHGAEFGAFGSRGRHFFNEGSRIYQELAKILELRKTFSALRRGRQYLRTISPDGETFYEPERLGEPYRGVVAWTRMLDVDEFICAINTDEEHAHTVWVSLDPARNQPGKAGPLCCKYSTSPAQIDEETDAPEERGPSGSAARITVPPGGFVIYR